MIYPVRQRVLSSAREGFNGRVLWRSSVGGGACSSGFGAPRSVRVTEQVIKIVPNTQLIICQERVGNSFLEFLGKRRALEDCHHGRREVVSSESREGGKPRSVIEVGVL